MFLPSFLESIERLCRNYGCSEMPVGPIDHDYVNPVRCPDCRLVKTIFFLSFFFVSSSLFFILFNSIFR